MRLNFETVVRAARCKAPFTGVTYLDGDGTHGRIILQSHLLREIMTCEFLRSAELTDTGKLKLSGKNGHRRAEYVLTTIPQQTWTIRDFQRRWAETQRRRVSRVKLSPVDRRRAKQLEQAAKLERKIARMGIVKPPANPVLAKRPEWYGDNRESATEWYGQRAKRQALARIAAGYIGKYSFRARVPWSEIYAKCAAVDCSIVHDSSYGRLRGLKKYKGLTVDSYLRRLWQYARLQSKSHDLRPHNVWGYHGSLASLQESRREYTAQMQEIKGLRAMIESLKTDVVSEAVEFVD